MNDPKRLIAESRSMLADELLRAAQSERIPDALRQRMAEGFAVTLGVGSIGAGVALGGGMQSGIQGGLVAAHSAGAAAGEAGATVGLSAAVGGANGAAAIGGATLAQGASWAGSAVWLKSVIAVCTLTGAVGLGSVIKQWAEPSAAPTTAVGQATSLPMPNELESAAAAREVEPADMAAPTQQHAASTDPVGDAREAKATRRAVRSKSKVSASEANPASELPGDLGREVRMLDAARRAILAGDVGLAREKLAAYGRAFPDGSLRAEAASLAKAAADAQ